MSHAIPPANATVSPDQETFWQQLSAVAHPSDRPLPAGWRQCYLMIREITFQLRPRRICEIGVRAGYSAFSMFSGSPDAYMLGIEADLDETAENTHGGRKGFYKHALQILQRFNYDLMIVNSHAIHRLPRFDLVYIDGDHSFQGCLSDLRMVSSTCDTILVDDVSSIPSVAEACEAFLLEHSAYSAKLIDNGLTGFMLLTRRV